MAIPSPRFDYGLVIGRFDTQRYLPLMHWQAQKAQQHLQATGQITVVIQDGLPFWQPRDSATLGCLAGARALFFFLPPHSPQMNRIEEEWLHLEGHELSAQLFEDEYDLAIALIEAIDERG